MLQQMKTLRKITEMVEIKYESTRHEAVGQLFALVVNNTAIKIQ